MADSLEFIFERANSALITRDFKYAEHLLTNILKKNPNLSPKDKQRIEDLLARIYVDAGDLEKSLEAYLRLYAQKPADTDIMNNLGRIYRHLGRFDEALEILEKAKQIGGLTDEVLYNLAKTYKRMHNYEKAAEYFSLAIEIKPDHAHAYDRLGSLYVLTGETDKAIETYKNGLRADSNHPYLNFHLAQLLRKEKRYEEAIVYYNSALRSNPSWSDALYELANTYLQIDKLDDALHSYRSLLRVSGESSLIYTELGRLFEKKRLEAEAEQYYYDALALDSGYAPAALSLSALLEKRKAYAECYKVLLSAETDPANKDNHELRLKTVELSIYNKDYAKASELIQKMSGQYANDINVLKLKGQVYALTGEIEEAERTFEKILQLSPSSIEFRRELAAQYLLANRYEDAKKQLELFLKQKPLDTAALMTLGQTYEALNNPKAAYSVYQKVLEQNPAAIEARSALSNLFQRHGNTIEALKTADEILTLQSTSSNQDLIHGLADTLALYERAAESYMVDPLLKKNLENLKPGEADLYISPSELEQNTTQYHIFPLFEETLGADRDIPFDLLAEKAEDEELSHDEKEETFDNIQLKMNVEDKPAAAPYPVSAPQYSPGSLQFQQGGFSGGRSDFFPPQVEELRLQPAYEVGAPEFDLTELTKILSNRPKHTRTLGGAAAPESRLQDVNAEDRAAAFLQDIAFDINRNFDEKQYNQVIETLAEKIAENLTGKVYVPQREETEDTVRFNHTDTEEAVDLPVSDLLADAVTGIEAVKDEAQDISVSSEEEVIADNQFEPVYAFAAISSNEPVTENIAQEVPESFIAPQAAQDMQEKETPLEIYHEEDFVDTQEYTVSETVPLSDISPAEEEMLYSDDDKKTEPGESFVLDDDQKNLLWCHAKRKLKESPLFEEYLSAANTEELAGLFLYLRDLLVFLPDDKREAFLSSSERMLVYYIISRLSGELGLKERAGLIQQSSGDSVPSVDDKTIVELLEYLRDLTVNLPDQEIGKRCRQDLDHLIIHLSSVMTA